MRNEFAWLLQLVIRPHRVAADAAAWPWPTAWGVHLAGLVLGVALMVPLVAFIDDSTSTEVFHEFFTGEAIAGWSVAFVLLEGCYVLAGAWTSSWGAGDEKCSQSVFAAMKRLWALTPHLMLVGVACGWCATRYGEIMKPWNEWWVFAAWVGYLAVSYYALGTTLAVLSAGRSSERTRWPACCEGCNYALVNPCFEEHCPECGLEVWKSLDHRVRGGLWQKWRAWSLISLRCFLHPRECGRAVRLFDDRSRVERRMWVSLGQFVCGSVLGVLFTVLLVSSVLNEQFDDWLALLVGSALWSAGIALFLGIVVIGTASLSGWAAGRSVQRNLMPAAIQLAARMSGIWVLFVWIYLGMFTLIVIGEYLDWFPHWGEFGFVRSAFFWLLVLFGPVVLFLLLWTVQLSRATRAARFSNV